MIEKDLDKVLNYMKQYVENKYEHDSEPMLNYKDLQLVLEEIERLQQRIDKAIEYIEKHSNSFSVLDTISNAKLLEILKGSEQE